MSVETLKECSVRSDPNSPAQNYGVVRKYSKNGYMRPMCRLLLCNTCFTSERCDVVFDETFSAFGLELAIDEIRGRLYLFYLNPQTRQSVVEWRPLYLSAPDQDGYRQVEVDDDIKHRFTAPVFSWVPEKCPLAISPVDGTLVQMQCEDDINYRLAWMHLDRRRHHIKYGVSREFDWEGGADTLQFLHCGKQMLVCLQSAGTMHMFCGMRFHVSETPAFALFNIRYEKGNYLDCRLERMQLLHVVSPTVPALARLAFKPDTVAHAENNQDWATAARMIGQCYKYTILWSAGKGDGLREVNDSVLFAVKDLGAYIKSKKMSYNAAVASSPARLGFDLMREKIATVWPTVGLEGGVEIELEEAWVRGGKMTVKFSVKRRGEKLMHMIEQELGDSFRDYRTCANCGIREKSKRRNRKRKRISSFKVCADCKARNFHLRWKDYPCHYCSLECIEAHWETHQKQHEALKL